MCYDGDKTSEAAHVKSRSNHKNKKKQLTPKFFYMTIEQSRRNGYCSIFTVPLHTIGSCKSVYRFWRGALW